MLSLKNRLKKTKEIKRVLREGSSFRQDFLVLKNKKVGSEEKKIGFVVSQKVSKRANIRNKITRRLRAIVRKKMGSIKEGSSILIMSLPGAGEKSFKETELCLNGLLKKAKLLNE